MLTVPDCNSTHIKPNSLDISGGSSGTMTGMVDPPVPVKRKALSYSEALQRAMTGDVGDNILEVLRFEHAQAQLDIAQQDLLVEIKINLGVALLQRGNISHAPDCFAYYEQALELFTAVLALQPGHSQAASNLKAARGNILLRTNELVTDA